MKSTILLLSSIITISIFIHCYIQLTYAISAYFPRQEIADPINDAIKRNSNGDLIRVDYANNSIDSIIANYIDISHVTYFSDGKTLNATLWLKYPGFSELLRNNLLKGPHRVDFGAYIDVNPESVSGSNVNETVSYHKQVIWPSIYVYDLPGYFHPKFENSWIENIHEVLSIGGHRYLKIEEKNYSDFFEREAGILSQLYPPFIPLSIDLKDINFPNKYKIMFYTDVYLNTSRIAYTDAYFPSSRIADFTNWIDIPPTKFYISTFPDKLNLRPDTSKNITGILKSIDGFIPNVTSFRIDEKNSIIKIQPFGTSYSSSSGIRPATFHIEVPSKDKIQAGEYTIPIGATVSIGSSLAPPEFAGTKHYINYANSSGYMNTISNVTINVLEPLGFNEQFREFWGIYGQPISIVAGGIAGGATTLLFDRFKKKV